MSKTRKVELQSLLKLTANDNTNDFSTGYKYGQETSRDEGVKEK